MITRNGLNMPARDKPHAFLRIGTITHYIPQAQDTLDPQTVNVPQNRFQRFQVAVNIRNYRKPHGPCVSPFEGKSRIDSPNNHISATYTSTTV